MTDRKRPWEDRHSIWKNEQQFLQWLRGKVRSIWTDHPVRNGYLDEKTERKPIGRKTVNNPNGQLVNAIPCEICGCWVKKSKPKGQRTADYNVDHLIGGEGFTNSEEFFEWMTRQLWVTSDCIRTLCTPCHKVVNIMQSHNLTFEQAKIEKKTIEICKGDDKKWLQSRGIVPGKNAKIRRNQIREVLLNEHSN